uniref:Hebreain-like protein n=1 Tax=Ornithodoros coriaceus TaxID=92741 RepID=B2D296_ORNCO|nr:hebreain-like protein [Ornithodoros coriaceus]
MKGFLLVVAVAAVVLLASAHHLDLCAKSDEELIVQLQCQRSLATALSRLDQVNRQLQCDTDLCTVRKLCAEPDFVSALRMYFNDAEIEELHQLANRCDVNAHHDMA